MEISYTILGNSIYNARLNAGLSPMQAANLLQLSIERYNRIERGETIPTLQMLVNICCAFGTTVDSLLKACYDDYFIRRQAEEKAHAAQIAADALAKEKLVADKVIAEAKLREIKREQLLDFERAAYLRDKIAALRLK